MALPLLSERELQALALLHLLGCEAHDFVSSLPDRGCHGTGLSVGIDDYTLGRQIDIYLGSWINALHGLRDRLDAVAAGHPFNFQF